ncbi:hypothetical protein [Kitasatospora fiedleri]|uniref:hypothetical protein n=1 Tax=Kitasatospora fiedleri TaxID=2991545 RepID=UPI00249C49EF|nr:hypothetical protein [Kitasatospora fiedleri]
MIKSAGGKSIRVYVHGEDVARDWTDPYGADGDALLTPADARGLAQWLNAAADLADLEGEQ